MEKAWSLALWSVLVCRIAIITDNSRGGRHRNHPKAERTEQKEIEKNEYLAWLEHKADRYTTVYGYMD